MADHEVIVEVRCDACGPGTIGIQDVVLILTWREDLNFYAFACPSCHTRVHRGGLAENVIKTMTDVGVEVRRLAMPAELSEEHVGAPLKPDDLLDFHLAIRSEDYLTGLV